MVPVLQWLANVLLPLRAVACCEVTVRMLTAAAGQQATRGCAADVMPMLLQHAGSIAAFQPYCCRALHYLPGCG